MAKVRELKRSKRQKSKFKRDFEASDYDNPFDFLYSKLNSQNSHKSTQTPKK